jgi:hypothetical protein
VTTADALLRGLVDGLRRRVAERGHAEARLGDFAFSEGVSPGPSGASPPAGGAPAAPGEVDWRYFISRTLAAVGETGTLDLLERLATGDETLSTLTGDASAGQAGRLAIADRIGGLAAAALAGRDLESGHVHLTALGSAVLAFALEWEHLAAGSGPADPRRPV